MADSITIGSTGWCQQSAVAARFAHVKTPLADDDTQTGVFITNRFREINGILLKQGKTLSELDGDTVAEAVLKVINEVGAAADVALARGWIEVYNAYREEYRAHLRQLAEDGIELGTVAGTRDDATIVPSTLLTGGDYDAADNRWKTDRTW